MTALIPILAGANMIYGPGMLEMGITMSFGQLVADADFIRMFDRVLDGIPVNDESLAIDLIHKVGPRGQFLGEKHTVKHFMDYQADPKVMNRDTRDDWKQAGAKDLDKKSNEIAREILDTHKPEVLSEETVKKIQQIVANAEKELIP